MSGTSIDHLAQCPPANLRQAAWELGLALFGLHLVAVGVIAWRSGDVPRWLGALVAIAGLGYLVDTFAKIVLPTLDLGFLMVTFFGEAVFAIWLVWRGFRR